MLFNPFLNQSAFRRSALCVAAMLLLPSLAFASSKAGGSCAPIEIMGDDSDIEIGDPEILSFDVDDADLRITLEIPTGFNGTLSWSDESGAAVMESLWIDPGAGPVEVTLTGVIDPANWPGFQYRLQLKALGMKKPLLSTPVRLQPYCPPNGSCVLVALPGVESTAPMIGPELALALRQARQAGASDVLGHVVQNDPGLQHQVLAFAWQGGIGDPADSSCKCSWLSEVTMSPAAFWGDKESPGPRHSHGVWRNSVHGATASQIVEGSIASPHSGLFEASLELACRRRTDSSLEPLSLGEQTIMVKVPVYEPCSDNCEPEIRHDTSSHTCLDTKVFSINGFRASADIGVGLTYEVDEQHVFSNLLGTFLPSSAAPDGDRVYNNRWESGIRTVASGRSTSSLELASHLSLKAAKPAEGTGSFAFGLLTSKFSMSLDAVAVCENQTPTDELIFDPDAMLARLPANDGGVMLVIWGDPPT